MKKGLKKTLMASALAVASVASLANAAPVTAPAKQPNILVIMGDDIGYWNLSTYNQGMMGYKTPNIDRIANEGGKFTDFYGQQSSTAGRSAFITGQMPARTGLTKVGMPGAKEGISELDPTMAVMLKDLGYATGQFGKNHLGDRDEHLPTNHGFDEFFGNLYHLNAEEEPEREDYPADFATPPRGVIRSSADGKIEDTGPLTKKRMETVDAEFMGAAKNFITDAVKEGKPFFTWMNTSRMHTKTHLTEESRGKTGLGKWADGMVEHDGQVGELLDLLEELKVDDNTIVLYTTDNGFQLFEWPDAGMSPFRGEKNTGWEGGFRIPALIKWPGAIVPGSTYNDIVSLEDFFPTFLSAAGNPTVKEDLLEGVTTKAGRSYKVHLDGYDQTDYLTGKAEKSPRDQFWYWSDDADLLAVRSNEWKVHFSIQEKETGPDVWAYPFTRLRVPKLFNLKIDPFERGDSGMLYEEWRHERPYQVFHLINQMKPTLATFADYPQRAKPGSFTIDDIIENMNNMKD
nr:arylsulfatase [Endozoicomonas sp.]